MTFSKIYITIGDKDMKVKTYKNTNKILFALMVAAISYSFYADNAFVSFLAVGFYLSLTSLLKTRVTGVLADERQKKVSEKAAQTSFKVSLTIFLLTTGLLIGGGNQQFLYIKALGIVLAYITCLCLLIYLATYWYFDKKTGGR